MYRELDPDVTALFILTCPWEREADRRIMSYSTSSHPLCPGGSQDAPSLVSISSPPLSHTSRSWVPSLACPIPGGSNPSSSSPLHTPASLSTLPHRGFHFSPCITPLLLVVRSMIWHVFISSLSLSLFYLQIHLVCTSEEKLYWLTKTKHLHWNICDLLLFIMPFFVLIFLLTVILI